MCHHSLTVNDRHVMASDLTNEFELVVESTYRVLRADLAVKHVARARLCQVSLDITVVAFGVRYVSMHSRYLSVCIQTDGRMR